MGLMEPQPGSGVGLGDNRRILGVVVLWPWSVCHLQLLGMTAMVPGMSYDWAANGHQLGIFWSFWMVPTINIHQLLKGSFWLRYSDTQLLSVLSCESDQLGPGNIWPGWYNATCRDCHVRTSCGPSLLCDQFTPFHPLDFWANEYQT